MQEGRVPGKSDLIAIDNYPKYLALEEEPLIESNSMMANKTSPWRLKELSKLKK